MNSEEHGLLADLFKNLRGAEAQPRDPEAEQFVLQAMQAQPSAPYYMAQAVVIQQQALAAAQTRIDELERRATEAEARAEASAAQAAQAPAGGGSFLANALGLGKGASWGSRAAPPPAPPPIPGQSATGQSATGHSAASQSAPGRMMPNQMAPNQMAPGQMAGGPAGQPPARNAWGLPVTGQQGGPGRPNAFGGQQQPGQPPQRSGFLAGAMQTAAGVAGGMLVAGAISSMLSGGNEPGGAEATTASTEPTDAGAASDAGHQQASYQDDSQQDAGYQDAGYDDGGFDDGGADDGGDWA